MLMLLGLVAMTSVAVAQDKPKIQLIVTFPNFKFYDTIEKGAVAKAVELGLDLVVSRPRFLEYPNNFISEIRKGIDQDVDAFAIAPVDG
jgi:ABC-type sugar transport system substrate-binding protein